jgi:spectinomycin phosphotransferase
VLEKPAIDDARLIACIRSEYGMPITELSFLPLGADFNTAVYCAIASDGTSYFMKLRREVFDAISVDVPKFLHDQGIAEIICPIESLTGALSVKFHMFDAIIYPFIDGKNGWEVALTETQWHIFGRAMRQIHDVALPSVLADRISHENYSPRFRERMRQFQAKIELATFAEPSAAALARLLTEKKSVVNNIIQRAEDLAAILQTQTRAHVLCHSDIHMGNLLLNGDKLLYIVDWDQPILAPRERDLMFIAGGVGGTQKTPEQEEALFFVGYGQTEVDPIALAYYRYERIVQDFVEFSEFLFCSNEGGEDRLNSLHHFVGQFLPGNVIDMAYRTEKLLPKEFRAA